MGILDIPGEPAGLSTATKTGLSSSYAPNAIPTGITAAKTFTARQSVYNNGSSMRKARAAQARALSGGSPMNVLLKADSIGQSTVAAPFNVNSWFARVQSMLESRYGKYGSGMNFLFDVSSQDTRYTSAGTWTRLASKGMVDGQAYTTVTAGSTLTFVDDFDTITVYYLKTTDGGTSSTYSLNGAAAVTFSSNGTEAVGSFTLTASRAINTLLITAPTTGRMTILAVDVRIGTTGGFRFQKAAVAGQKVGNFVSSATVGSPLALSASIANPDLTIIALETNDYGNSATPLASYQADLTTLIVSGLATGSVALVATVTPQRRRGADGVGGTGDDIPLATSPVLLDYNQVIYSLADTYDLTVVDMQARWGSWATANAAGLMADDYHPSDLGNQDYAQTIYEALFGYGQGDGALTTSRHQFTARQTFGVTKALELGQFEYGGFPTTPYFLTTSGNNVYLGNETGGYWMVRTDLLMQAGKKIRSENSNLPSIDASSFMRVVGIATATRPTAANGGVGGFYYDTTLSKPIWSDGTNWRDSAGTIV